MDSSWILYLLPLLAGALNSVQSGANGTLNRAIEAPAVVALIALALALTTVGLAFGKLAVPEAGRAAIAPWWAWLGGMLGAAVIIAQPIAAPRLGAANFMGVLVTASVCASLALDHFGLVGFPEHAASWGRLAGAALMIAGVWLVATL